MISNKKLSVIFLALPLLLFGPSCFAVPLEAQYPQLPGGGQITEATTVPEYLKYVFDFGMGLGIAIIILSLAISGILYFISIASYEAKAAAMDRIYGSLMGLGILLLCYIILTTINPSLSIFSTKDLDPNPQVELKTIKQTGVFFFNTKADCNALTSYTLSDKPLADLGNQKNRVHSIKIVPNPETGDYYITILYNDINFQGPCQYFSYQDFCFEVPPFAASASIYKYSFIPSGNSVTFYRNPSHNPDGGYLRITNADITSAAQGGNAAYETALKNLTFENDGKCTVPIDDQDCIRWDAKNNCLERKCPKLSGDNIGSIKIDGDYVVMLRADIPTSTQTAKWDACQLYPKVDDASQLGPKLLKWDYIHSSGRQPNYLLIFPIKK